MSTETSEIALPRDRLWNAKQAAAYLGLSLGEVYASSRRGEIPSIRLGPKGLRFRPSELEAWVEARKA